MTDYYGTDVNKDALKTLDELSKANEQAIRADERQKVLAEVLEWSKARQYSDEYGVDVAIRFSELRAKLEEMKGENNALS